MSILGNRIKKEREKLDLTREDLAKKIGVSYSAIAMYEQGHREPSNALIIKMCELFGCSVDYLIGATAIRNPKEDLEKDLIKLHLTKQELESAIDIYKSFVEKNNLPDSVCFDDLINSDNKVAQAYNLICSYAYDYFNYKMYDWDSRKYSDSNEFLEHIENKSNKEVLTLINSLNIEKIVGLSSNSYLYTIPVLGKIAAGQPILVEENLEGYLPVEPSMFGMDTSEDYFYLRVSGDSMNLKVENGDYVLIHKQDYAEDGDLIVAIVNGDNEATLKRYRVINEQFIQLEPLSTNTKHETKTIDLKSTSFLVIGKAIGKFGKF